MSTSGSESRSGLVLELAEEFLDRYRAGQHHVGQALADTASLADPFAPPAP